MFSFSYFYSIFITFGRLGSSCYRLYTDEEERKSKDKSPHIFYVAMQLWKVRSSTNWLWSHVCPSKILVESLLQRSNHLSATHELPKFLIQALPCSVYIDWRTLCVWNNQQWDPQHWEPNQSHFSEHTMDLRNTTCIDRPSTQNNWLNCQNSELSLSIYKLQYITIKTWTEFAFITRCFRKHHTFQSNCSQLEPNWCNENTKYPFTNRGAPRD